MPQNFSLADFVAGLLAFVLFALFAFIPGYVVAWATDLLEFRKRLWLARIALAIPLSIGLAPVMAFLAGRFLSFSAIWFVFGLLWLAFPVICSFELRTHAGRLRLPPRFWWYAAMAGAWLAIGLFSLIDLQFGHRLYFSVVSMDYTLRSAIVSSISRTGIPPANPLFFFGHAIPLRYHYFWLIPCSLVNLLGGSLVSARQAIIGGTLWCGLGLMAIVAAFLRFVHPAGSHRIHRRAIIGIALLCVTGLDILPNLLLDSLRFPQPDPEWWNEQVSSWITSVLWVPHHTAALIAGLMAVLIIWSSTLALETRRRIAWAVVAGLCLATCAGASVYVGLVIAASLAVWSCILLLKRSWREVFFAAGAGMLALCAVAPHLLSLRTPAASHPGTAAAAIVFSVRRFLPDWAFHAWSHGSALRENLLNASLLPLNYFLELGAFLVAGIWTLRRWLSDRKGMNRYRLCTFALAGTSFLICTFFRSAVIPNNDLGWRGFLLGQFVLLLWTVDLLDQVPAARRVFLTVLIVIGVASSIYEAATLRLYPIAFDALDIPRQVWLGPDHNLGRRTYALRSGYEALKNKLPARAVVQHNPIVAPDDLPYGLYADRPVVAEAPDCGGAFGGDPESCAFVASALHPIFAGSLPAAGVDRTCTDLSISAVLVKDTDPAWRNRASWIWHRQPIVANRFMRALPCGSGAERLLSGY